MECVCQEQKDIFKYIGGVPNLLGFDNVTGVGRRVLDKVTEIDLFSRFRAHDGFQIRFYNLRAEYEKCNVENKQGMLLPGGVGQIPAGVLCCLHSIGLIRRIWSRRKSV